MYKIIISAYNEENNIYTTLKSNIKHASETIVIDDGSTDNTWNEMNRFFIDFPNIGSKIIRMKKNGKKILSIKAILKKLNSSIKYVILLDADSTLSASETTLKNLCKKLEKDNLSAASFRIMVKNRKSILGKLFNIESDIREFWNSFVSTCYKLRCVPGGGSIFKRDILEKALVNHSGEFYGEDLETTAIIIENKKRIGYFPNIVSKTLVPPNVFDSLKQRIRWEAGAMRVYIRKRNFYIKNIFSFDRHAFLWILEMIGWILFPLFLFSLISKPTVFFFSYFGSLGYVIMSINGKSKNHFPLIFVYPLFYLINTSIARIASLGWLIKYYFKR